MKKIEALNKEQLKEVMGGKAMGPLHGGGSSYPAVSYPEEMKRYRLVPTWRP